MKIYALVVILLMEVLQTHAQDYLIDFAATGGSSTVDSVEVRNLTQNTRLMLNGTDVLHLKGVTGIDQAIAQTNANLRIYPNPSNERCLIEFEATSPGISTIGISDISGKQVAQTQTMLACGWHTFALGGLSSGNYTLTIRSEGYVYSGKIVSTGASMAGGTIKYLSAHHTSAVDSKLKGIQSLVQMQYNNRDQLLFKCFSGIYSTIIPLVPAQSQTVTANFVACTDAEDHNYATVTIGSQIWMAENLHIGIRIDGTQEQTNNGIIEMYCYHDSTENCDIYGGLYQWNEMMQYLSTEGVQGICPTGWHIPTDADWCAVTRFLDPTVDCGMWGDSGTDGGGKMKSTGTLEAGTGLWLSPNAGASNKSGFTAFPAGYRNSHGEFWQIGIQGFWWSSSEYYPGLAWYQSLIHGGSAYYRLGNYLSGGFSVRCVRDL